MDLRAAQLQYEIDSDVQAAADHLQQLRLKAQAGDADLPRASRFVAHAFATVQDHIQGAMDVQTKGIGGKYKGWLRAVPADVAAVIAIRECIRMCTSPRAYSKSGVVTVTLLAKSIGMLYETEVKVAQAEAVNPIFVQKVTDQIKERGTTSKHHIRAVYNTTYDRVMKGELDSKLIEGELVQLGKFGLDACVQAGIVVVTHTGSSKGTLVTCALSAEALEFLTDYSDADVQRVTSKQHTLMRCPPEPWTSLHGGGYISERRKVAYPLMSLRHIRPAERKRLRERFTPEHMPVIFATANYMQSIPYSLHAPTAEAINRVWKTGGGLMGVPDRNGPVEPKCPFPPSWTKADGTEEEVKAFRRWKFQKAAWYTARRKWGGKVREIGGFMKALQDAWPEFYMPVFLDTRGRWYYRGTPNPQGSDMAKAVIHFARKKPLGERGLYWLKVHIANSLGYDKERMDVRASYVDGIWHALEAALDAPEDHADVWGTDAPWCAYAAAWELREAYRSGDPASYCTGIAVHMDATCSGLQHFSAILRDEVGGKYVNLYDDEFVGPKQDIYSYVSTNALASMKMDLRSNDPETVALAQFWIEKGIPRDLAKTPVMTYVYGATLLGTAKHIEGKMDEYGQDFPEEAKVLTYTMYAGRKLFAGIAMTVPSAAAAMRWLKEVARDNPKGQRMEWTAPNGFLVQHDYQASVETKVRIRSCGVQQVIVKNYTEDTIPSKMQNAISPNFVHALDASHMSFTAIGMSAKGHDLVGIHDSCGTHPSSVQEMHGIIREAFIKMYDHHDLFNKFLWEVGGVGSSPVKGKLDLNRVLQSEFFFC